MLVQQGKDPEYSDTIAVLVVAVTADVGPGGLIASPQYFGPAHRTYTNRLNR
jgi:hypothetical protein